jgi:very-short-patch-repair endonuclease
VPLRRRTLLARKLRENATDVERLLWRALRESTLPWKFRRQHPIGGRIADFACPARKLVIELDGSQHIAGAVADEKRDDELAARGYRVIRFWNNDILENLEGVLTAIQQALEQSEGPPPLPDPLRPEGRRGR